MNGPATFATKTAARQWLVDESTRSTPGPGSTPPAERPRWQPSQLAGSSGRPRAQLSTGHWSYGASPIWSSSRMSRVTSGRITASQAPTHLVLAPTATTASTGGSSSASPSATSPTATPSGTCYRLPVSQHQCRRHAQLRDLPGRRPHDAAAFESSGLHHSSAAQRQRGLRPFRRRPFPHNDAGVRREARRSRRERR